MAVGRGRELPLTPPRRGDAAAGSPACCPATGSTLQLEKVVTGLGDPSSRARQTGRMTRARENRAKMFGEECCLCVPTPASRNPSPRYRCCCSYPSARGEITLFLVFLRASINSLRITGKKARAGTPKAFDLSDRSNLSGDRQRDGIQGRNSSCSERRVLHFQNQHLVRLHSENVSPCYNNPFFIPSPPPLY